MEISEESAALLAKKPTNAKTAIIKKLSHQWPINAKAMTLALQREFGIEITYQGVHKALTQLEEEKIIEKGEKGYQLFMGWIDDLRKFTQKVSSTYNGDNVFDPNREINQLKFKTFLEMAKFVVGPFEELTPNPESKIGICQFQYCWPVIGASDVEFEQLKTAVKKYPHYCIVKSDTVLDRHFSDALEKIGKHTVTSKECFADYDIVVKGDYIVQVYFEKKFKIALSKFYRDIKQLNELNISEFFQKVLQNKSEINVIIIKNKAIADQIRRQTLEVFNS